MAGTRDLLSIDDLEPPELTRLIEDAQRIKKDPAGWADAIAGRQVALIFEKPSTRTRISFEVAVTSMGGHAVVLRGDELQLGRGETIEDTGRVLGRYVDAVVIRTFGQDRLERLADACPVPVVNALSDFSHPCQALADLQTIAEKKGELRGLTIAYIGDGNNVAHSLMFGGVKLGMEVRVACPPGYEPFPQVVDRCAEIARETGGKVTVTSDPVAAATGADVLYTDVWTSMGQEDQAGQRENVFEGFQVNYDLIDRAGDDVLVMHCLPAHRGQEISADAIDGPHSVVWDQAENRLHAQKALLVWLLT
ncbi:MAG: ornithine carbamoyltransferase [Actinomycetota bacterium]|nr:ornithine carbamoyltransferase [Actinomycetota bacterium]